MSWISVDTRRQINTWFRFVFGAIFVYSGISKLLMPVEHFQVAINMYELGSDAIVLIASYVVPWIEFIFGAFLVLGYAEKISASVLVGLCFVFQIVLGSALVRKLLIDECGCFGGGFIHMTLYQSFALDTVMALALIQVASGPPTRLSLDGKLLGDAARPREA